MFQGSGLRRAYKALVCEPCKLAFCTAALVVSLATVSLANAATPVANAATPVATLDVTNVSATLLWVKGAHFPASSNVTVAAELTGCTGQGTVNSNVTGTFTIGFSPGPGCSGAAKITAWAGIVVARWSGVIGVEPPAATTGPPTGSPASKPGAKVCDKFGSTPVAGGAYLVQNNVWGDNTEQCLTAFSTGFRIDKATHDKSSGPAAYPSIVSGCWQGTCTTGTRFPALVSSLPPITSSWSVTTPATGKYNVAYDIWLDPTMRKTGQSTGAELMIWLKEQGGIDPIGGQKSATVQLGGATWDVWIGKNGATPVISWVRQQPTDVVNNLPITDFVKDAMTRGVVDSNWYLTNIQAGFEPWQGGQGLSVNSFSVSP